MQLNFQHYAESRDMHPVQLPRVMGYVRDRRIGQWRGEAGWENWTGGPEAEVTEERFLASVMLDGEQTLAPRGAGARTMYNNGASQTNKPSNFQQRT